MQQTLTLCPPLWPLSGGCMKPGKCPVQRRRVIRAATLHVYFFYFILNVLLMKVDRQTLIYTVMGWPLQVCCSLAYPAYLLGYRNVILANKLIPHIYLLCTYSLYVQFLWSTYNGDHVFIFLNHTWYHTASRLTLLLHLHFCFQLFLAL